MIIMRRSQIAALSAITRKIFEKHLTGRVQDLYPEQCVPRGEEWVRAAISRSVDRASNYGCETERDLARYVLLCFTFGRDFDQELSWARRALADPMPSEAKMDALWSQALELEDEARGYGDPSTIIQPDPR
jgi:hypothetical protein